jgi:hypothetical protein
MIEMAKTASAKEKTIDEMREVLRVMKVTGKRGDKDA